MRLAIGADINGFETKEAVKRQLEPGGREAVDLGVREDDYVGYPEVGEVVARAVAAGDVERCVLVCGAGLGMAIVAD